MYAVETKIAVIEVKTERKAAIIFLIKKFPATFNPNGYYDWLCFLVFKARK